MMGPTRRPIRYLSGLSPIQALSLSCLITYSGSDIGGRVHKRHVRAHAGQPRTRVHTVHTGWRVNNQENQRSRTSGADNVSVVRKGFDFQISPLPSSSSSPARWRRRPVCGSFVSDHQGDPIGIVSHSVTRSILRSITRKESRPTGRPTCVYIRIYICTYTRSRPSSSLRSLLREEEVVWRKNERPRRSAPSAFELRFPIKWIVPVAAP